MLSPHLVLPAVLADQYSSFRNITNHAPKLLTKFVTYLEKLVHPEQICGRNHMHGKRSPLTLLV
jgi:hypothetical protein